MKSNKIEFMHFKQDAVISKLNDKPLKLIDHFTYISCNISFTESKVNIHIDRIKQEFYQAVAMSVLLNGCTT